MCCRSVLFCWPWSWNRSQHISWSRVWIPKIYLMDACSALFLLNTFLLRKKVSRIRQVYRNKINNKNWRNKNYKMAEKKKQTKDNQPILHFIFAGKRQPKQTASEIRKKLRISGISMSSQRDTAWHGLANRKTKKVFIFSKFASFLFAKLQPAEHHQPGSTVVAVLIFNWWTAVVMMD